MRSLVVLGLVGSSSIAVAQPPPPPPPGEPVEVEPAEGTSFKLRAGLGIGRYGERTQGLKFEADLQPFALVGAELAVAAGRGHLVLQAQAGLGSEVHMQATQQGMVVQENEFHQQVFEASPRYRHPVNRTMYVEGGYRLTIQRLFFTGIPTIGDALETVTVHALEAGVGWRKPRADGSTTNVAFVVGLNRGGAENDRIEGEDFTASGISLDARLGRRWASGLVVEGEFAYRKQNGSDVGTVRFNGMETTAVWPANTTWQLLAVAGFKL